MVPGSERHPWLDADVPRGNAYDERFGALEAAGVDVHGEADLVMSLGPASVLDAGCGTGRVAIELDRRGIEAVGVDLDPDMLSAARAKAPQMRWEQADLAELSLGRTFDAVVLAGNVLVFVAPGTEPAVVQAVARHLSPGGLLIAGFALDRGLGIEAYDLMAASSGLKLRYRWSTWGKAPFTGSESFAVSVHRSDIGS